MTKEDIIEKLGLSPLPGEGGFFRRTWASEIMTDSNIPAGSAIYYMVTNEEWGFSALHSLPKVEIYHFYAGSPVHLWLFNMKGNAERITLGNRPDKDEIPQVVVPAGVIQGSQLACGEWALLGTTMVPAYCESDYKPADREKLLDSFPQHSDIISRLCRQK